MEDYIIKEKNRRTVKFFAWVLITLTLLVLLKDLFFSSSLFEMIRMQKLTAKVNPPVGINFTLYFVQYAVEIILCVFVFISATLILNFKNIGRALLVYSLIASIIFILVSPLITYYNFPSIAINGLNNYLIKSAKMTMLMWSYIWSIIFSSFFLFAVIKLSSKNVIELFH